jgi:hypothetical protein
MRAQLTGLSLALLLAGGIAAAPRAAGGAPAGHGPARPQAQNAPVLPQPDVTSVYCAGFVTADKVPADTYVISGEESNAKLVFSQDEYVFINKGANQGVHVGDQFSVIRASKDALEVPWFRWQGKLMRAMGTLYDDIGRVRVTTVQPNVSIARVAFSCHEMQRGDIARPYEDRPAPPYKDPAQFDIFAPVSGKPVAMVVTMKDFFQQAGTGSIVYINLGTGQGVKVGDYFRVFRYQGSRDETAPQTAGYQDRLFGLGSTPLRYSWNNLPRQVLGEGIVLNVSRNSSTVLLTYSRIEIYAGDYVELE